LKLKELRGRLEHVKPEGWSLEVSGLPQISVSVAVAFATLLESFAQRLEVDELDQVKASISKIREQRTSDGGQ
jgi:hypothetical protein